MPDYHSKKQKKKYISDIQSSFSKRLSYVDAKIFVVVDHREKPSKVGTELKKWGMQVVYRMLEAGDYIVGKNCVIERKTFSDYCTSLGDGRLFDQISRIKSLYRTVYLVVEGWDLYYQSVHPNAVFGSLAAITEKLQVNLIYTASISETANFIAILARRKQLRDNEKQQRTVKSGYHARDFRVRILANFPQIGIVQAHRLLKRFGSLEGIFTASKKELLEVKGMGNVSVTRLQEILKGKRKAF